MLADVFHCQKQQIWPLRKRQGLLFPRHDESFRPCFSYENPRALFYRRRKFKANYFSPNRYLPKLVVGCPCLMLDIKKISAGIIQIHNAISFGLTLFATLRQALRFSLSLVNGQHPFNFIIKKESVLNERAEYKKTLVERTIQAHFESTM